MAGLGGGGYGLGAYGPLAERLLEMVMRRGAGAVDQPLDVRREREQPARALPERLVARDPAEEPPGLGSAYGQPEDDDAEWRTMIVKKATDPDQAGAPLMRALGMQRSAWRGY